MQQYGTFNNHNKLDYHMIMMIVMTIIYNDDG